MDDDELREATPSNQRVDNVENAHGHVPPVKDSSEQLLVEI
jgi:hypothetical protein